METIPILLPVGDDFWQALDDNDLAEADELLRPATKGTPSDPHMPEERDNDLLAEHMHKYVRKYDGEITSREIEDVEFEADMSQAYVQVDYHVSVDDRGCNTRGSETDHSEFIRVSLDRNNKRAEMHVLKNPILIDEAYHGV